MEARRVWGHRQMESLWVPVCSSVKRWGILNVVPLHAAAGALLVVQPGGPLAGLRATVVDTRRGCGGPGGSRWWWWGQTDGTRWQSLAGAGGVGGQALVGAHCWGRWRRGDTAR